MVVDVIVVILLLTLIGVFPAWPHSRNWGYGPSAGISVVLVIVVLLLIMRVL